MNHDDPVNAEWEGVAFSDNKSHLSFKRTGLERIRVPGGWLYRQMVWDSEAVAVALAFVPHPEP
jgi:hypothetical protein